MMPTSPLDITAIKALHQAGHLHEAELAYLALLKNHPNDATSLHFLGILYVEENKLDKARDCFERAIDADPDNPVLQLHLANVLKHKGLFDQAEAILIQAAGRYANFAAIYNNLGALYFAQQKWQQAIDACQQAIKIQANYVDAYYNLGLALNKLQKYVEASNAFHALLALSPDHVGARFHLGCLLMQKQQNQAALEQFAVIYRAHPYHVETLMNMGTCYLRLNLLDDAKAYYLHALDVTPNDIPVLFNLGVIESQQGHTKKAIDYYLRIIAIDPDVYPAQYNVAVSYLALKQPEAALSHFQVVLRLRPDETVNHLVKVLSGSGDVTASPPAYIKSLFDAYADHYDQHMTNALHYEVPKLFKECIEFAHNRDKRKWSVLDIGCGTGLCGDSVKHLSQVLVGVDISEQMLALAQTKHIYDELVCADVLSYLEATKTRYDMVLAGDVLVYFGVLDDIFFAISRVLKQGGWFLFNVEKGETEAYSLQVSGRFAHTQAYIEQIAVSCQFEVVKHQTVTLRAQDKVPVVGYVYLLRKQ